MGEIKGNTMQTEQADDLSDILSTQTTPEATETGEQQVPPAAEPEGEQQQEVSEPEAKTVPVEALQDERRKRQEFKSQLDEANTRLDGFERQLAANQTTPQTYSVPDMYEDPEGFAQYQSAQASHNLQNSIANLSEAQTRRAVGNEVVDSALTAAKNAGVAGHFAQAADPYGDLIEWHEQHKLSQEIGNDPKSYREKVRAEERTAVLKEYGLAANTKAGSSPPVSVPQSLASTPSAQGAGQAWDGPPSLNQLLD